MNPDYSGPGYLDSEKEWKMLKKEQLKKSQTYKRSNQTHPAFRKGGRK